VLKDSGVKILHSACTGDMSTNQATGKVFNHLHFYKINANRKNWKKKIFCGYKFFQRHAPQILVFSGPLFLLTFNDCI